MGKLGLNNTKSKVTPNSYHDLCDGSFSTKETSNVYMINLNGEAFVSNSNGVRNSPGGPVVAFPVRLEKYGVTCEYTKCHTYIMYTVCVIVTIYMPSPHIHREVSQSVIHRLCT